MTASVPRRISDDSGLDEACARSTAVIYKHSPRCGASLAAMYQVERFMESAPDVPVYLVDVVRDQRLALEIDRRLDVRHESPQVILLEAGVAVWDASHRAVTASALTRALGSQLGPHP